MSASLKIDGLAIGVLARIQLQRIASKLRGLAAGAAVIAALGIALTPAAQGAKIAPQDPSRPHVYLMRGLMNIFSLGMDQLATQVARNGIEATVYNHSVAETVVQTIAQKYRGGDHGPYILVGHSLGADAVMTMAAQLNLQGVPVALVVPFDGTGSYAASGNVSGSNPKVAANYSAATDQRQPHQCWRDHECPTHKRLAVQVAESLRTGARSGFAESMNQPLLKQCLAEFLGTLAGLVCGRFLIQQ